MIIITIIAIIAAFFGSFAALQLLSFNMLKKLWDLNIPRFSTEVEIALAAKLQRLGWTRSGVQVTISEVGNCYVPEMSLVCMDVVALTATMEEFSLTFEEALLQTFAHECGHTHQPAYMLAPLRRWSVVLECEADAWKRAESFTQINPSLAAAKLATYHMAAAVAGYQGE